MIVPKILILGGSGNTGRLLAELLLQETGADLVLAGRNEGRAGATAAALNERFGGQRAKSVFADAARPESLARAFSGMDLVVAASSTARYAANVAAAALETEADYLDVQYSSEKLAALQAMAGQIEAAGRCFITDGGFHPGLPAALIRAVAPHFDRLEKARVGSVIQIDWAALELSPATMDEFVGEFMDMQMLVFRDGRWQKAGALAWIKPMTMDFGGEFGRGTCMPMFLEEMRAVPELFPGLRETVFYVGGFNWFVDWLVAPLVMAAMALWPERALRPMGRLMGWGLRTFSRPPFGTLLKVEAEGQKDGQARRVELTAYHKDGYWFTAIPAAACLLQLLDGSIKRPGLWLQATAVEPQRLLQDMARMGIAIRLS